MDSKYFILHVSYACALILMGWTQLSAAAPRYRRSQTTTTTPTTPTTTPITTTTLSQPIQVHEEPHHVYLRLKRDTDALREFHEDAYRQFITERFADPYITTDDIHVPNIPNSNNLPDREIRFAMSKAELLLLHYTNLLTYEQGIEAVYIDENVRSPPPSYENQLHISRVNLRRVRRSLEIAMLTEELHEHVVTTAVNPFEFSENANENVRNLRNLYVLQELHHYLLYAYNDFVTLYHRVRTMPV